MLTRVVVAPSGFKESLSAQAAADAIAGGVRRVLPDVVLDLIPLVDGGEGTATALAAATGGRLVALPATGPVGERVGTHFALLGSRDTAVVEMAAVAGLSLVPRARRDPGATTTYGVGELIRAALDTGVRRILVGCGDSGTSDGGAGALQALGARLLDADGFELPHGGGELVRLARIDPAGLDPRLRDVELLVACNPYNVLCGERGVARVFGPQKGATPAQVEHLSTGLENWARVLTRDLGVVGTNLHGGPGTGASGGLGAGLAALGARLLPASTCSSTTSTWMPAWPAPTWSSPPRAPWTTRPPAARSRPRSPAGPSCTAARCSRWRARWARAPTRCPESTRSAASCPRRWPWRRPWCGPPNCSRTRPNAPCG